MMTLLLSGILVLSGMQTVPFQPPKDIAGGSVSGVSSMDAGDIDRDGLVDVVAIEGGKHAGGRKTFAWFKAPSNTQGSWTRRNISHGAALRSFLGSAKLADMDKDGDLDLIVSSDNHSGGSKQADVFVFRNPGGAATGTWAHYKANGSTMALHHINDMEIADMDNDGKPDIVVRSLDPNQIHIFFQNSISSYTKKSINTGISASEGLAVGKLDGDAFPDITFTGHWFKSPSNPRTQNYTKLNIDSGYKNTNQNTKEAVADIDGDGRLDVVIGPAEAYRNGGNHVLAWYRNPGNTSSANWQRSVIKSNTNNSHTVKTGDIDNDGDQDVVVGIAWSSSGTTKSVLVYYNNGSGGFGSAQTVTSGKGLYSGVVADLGNDGDLDIIGQDTYSGSSKPWVYESTLSSSTPTIPNAPTGLSATVVSESRINLAWSDAANDEDGFRIQRATSSGGPWTQIATVGSNATSYGNTGLSPSTTYYYRVRAYNSAGNSSWSNTANATTLALQTPPSAPSGLTATAVSTSQINLSWTDTSNDEDGFRIQRATSAGGPWTQIATPGKNSSSYSSTGLAASTQYFYRVRAYNAAGNSSWSNTANATTQAAPTPPAAPSGLSATAVSSSAIDLAWTDNSNDETGFRIERDGVQISTVGSNVKTYSDTGLTASTAYSYRIRATNAVGNSGYSNTASATTLAPPVTPPAAPSGLATTAVSSSAIDLAWSDNSNNETGFRIERGGVEIATVGAGVTGFSDSGLTASTTYSYRVRATNSAGDSGYSNTASATTQAPPVTPPPSPSGLTATAVSSSAIDLAWTDNSNNETGFRIERGGVEIATVGAGVTAYADSGLSASTAYSYRVRATNGAGSSGYSNTASATTLAPPVTPPAAPSGLAATAVSSSAVDLSWSDNSNNETAFRIERGGVEIATVGAGVSVYSDTGLAASTAYSYRVRATNSAGNSAYSNSASATTLSGGAALPAPWFTQDIGAVGATGSASISGGTFTVDGSGADIWSTADEFRIVYQDLIGDGSVIARLVSQGNTNGWAKAGPMIRESLGANSKHAVMALTPSNGATFDRRTTTAGTTTKTVLVGAAAPLWVRLTRVGDLLTGYVSTDGVTWTEVDNIVIPMAADVLAGLAVTSHNDGAISTAVFDGVMVTAGVDSDGDGMSDGDETANGYDAYYNDEDGNGVMDGQDDWDGDGTINYQELVNGSKPGAPPGGGAGSGGGTGTGAAPLNVGSEGSEACGATGAEAVLILGLLWGFRRREKKVKSMK